MAGKGKGEKKARNFEPPHLPDPPFGAPPYGCLFFMLLFFHLVVFFEKEGQKTETPILAKVGLAKVGHLRLAKVGISRTSTWKWTPAAPDWTAQPASRAACTVPTDRECAPLAGVLATFLPSWRLTQTLFLSLTSLLQKIEPPTMFVHEKTTTRMCQCRLTTTKNHRPHPKAAAEQPADSSGSADIPLLFPSYHR